MSSAPATALCILSIDVCGPADAAAADLCRKFADADVPVTWSLSEPPTDKFREAIDGHTRSEVALLAEPSWAAEGSSRNSLYQGLADGLATLRSVGLTPTSLSLPNARLAAHDDLLVSHGLSAVRVATERQPEPRVRGWWGRNKSATKALSALRWGLWEAVVNVDLGVTGLAGAVRAVDRITRRAEVAVLAANATTLEREAKRLPRLLDHLKRRRDEKALLIETVAAAVGRQQVPRQTPSRSILRPAA
jgi:hypothetical protein